jgi:hypothetical protein
MRQRQIGFADGSVDDLVDCEYSGWIYILLMFGDKGQMYRTLPLVPCFALS